MRGNGENNRQNGVNGNGILRAGAATDVLSGGAVRPGLRRGGQRPAGGQRGNELLNGGPAVNDSRNGGPGVDAGPNREVKVSIP